MFSQFMKSYLMPSSVEFMKSRHGAEVLGTLVLEYIFEILVLVLIEIVVIYSYSCSMYSDFMSTL